MSKPASCSNNFSSSAWNFNGPNNYKLREYFFFPLDTREPFNVYGLHVWKNRIRKFSGLAISYNSDVNLHVLNNVVKLQSLIRNHGVFAYTWYKSGRIDDRPNEFKNPVDFSFPRRCFVRSPSRAIVRCAWCNKFLRLRRFLHEFHRREE